MKEYELVFVTKTDTDGENLKKEILDQIEKSLEKEKGKMGTVEEMGKKELAYPIQKEKTGNYTIVSFTSSSDVPGALTGKLRLEEDLLRFMLITKEKEKKEKEKGKEKE